MMQLSTTAQVEIIWYITNLNLDNTYSIRAVAQDVTGNETSSEGYHNCMIKFEGGLNYIFDNCNYSGSVRRGIRR
ncbi:hypothetical protein KKE26_00505 [bacterium]|nr:hypothetical protein [bacterium]